MSRDNETPTCGNCRFWDERSGGDGYCRRHPPRPQVVRLLEADTDRYAVFPVTAAEDWCGELVEVQPDY